MELIMGDDDVPDEFDRPAPVKHVQVAVGGNTAQYDKGRRVSGVYIMGQRAKPLKLRRMQYEDLKAFMPGARGVPTFYALTYTDRTVHLWPHCVHDMTVQIEYGETTEDTGEKTE